MKRNNALAESQAKRSKTNNNNDDVPPENGKTIGDYFKDSWFKSGLSAEQKEDFLLELKIKTLKRNSNFRQEAQKFLKIDLEHFLNTGNERLIDNSFSKVKYPVNDMGIKRLPDEADLAFANMLIQCEPFSHPIGRGHRLHQYYVGKQWTSELEMLLDKNSRDQTTYRELCIEIARYCRFIYRSDITKELYRRSVLDVVHETKPDEKASSIISLSEEQFTKLIAKMLVFFVRHEQQKLTANQRWYCDHTNHTWTCCEDARLLETLLDPDWRALMQFAILPCGETLVNGSDQTVASTVWNTAICVLYNNKKCYKLQTRFPTDADYWEFIPHHQAIRNRSAELLKGRLETLRSHFARLFENWKGTADASFQTNLKPTSSVFSVDGNYYENGNYARSGNVVLNLTALYMFKIWSQNQNDEFVSQAFGVAYNEDEHDTPSIQVE